MLSKLTCVLCYVALLRLRQGLSSALHLHLCRLSPFRYYPPGPYSKMFVGGLSWDTTDGTLPLLILPLSNVMSICKLTKCGSVVLFLLFSPLTRGLAELFCRVWQSRRLHHCSGC